MQLQKQVSSSCSAGCLGLVGSKVCCQVVECPLVFLSALPALGSTGTTERINYDPPMGYLPAPTLTHLFKLALRSGQVEFPHLNVWLY